MSAWSVKTRRAPSQHCRGTRVCGHTNTTMHGTSTPRSSPSTLDRLPPSPPTSTLLHTAPGARGQLSRAHLGFIRIVSQLKRADIPNTTLHVLELSVRRTSRHVLERAGCAACAPQVRVLGFGSFKLAKILPLKVDAYVSCSYSHIRCV